MLREHLQYQQISVDVSAPRTMMKIIMFQNKLFMRSTSTTGICKQGSWGWTAFQLLNHAVKRQETQPKSQASIWQKVFTYIKTMWTHVSSNTIHDYIPLLSITKLSNMFSWQQTPSRVGYLEVKIDVGSLKAEFCIWFSTEVTFFNFSSKTGITREGFVEYHRVYTGGTTFLKLTLSFILCCNCQILYYSVLEFCLWHLETLRYLD